MNPLSKQLNDRVSSDISENDDYSIELQVEKLDIKQHRDFEIKYAEEDKRMTFYIELCPADLANMIRDPGSVRNKHSSEMIKNCIFYKKIETPKSCIKGNFHITYMSYKGLFFNLYLNKQSSYSNPDAVFPLSPTQELLARTKIIWDNPQNSDKKYLTKWVEGTYEFGTFSFHIASTETMKILNSKLLLQIMVDRIQEPCKRQKGLINQGNLCYMNSFLQVLYHLMPFRKLVIEYPEQKIKHTSLLGYLQELFLQLETSPRTPTSEVLLKHFHQFNSFPREQQDIHQFMISLFDDLEKQLPEISEFWCGKDTEIIRSHDKKYQSKQDQDFNELQLHIIDSRGNSLPTIEQAIKQLQVEQKVDGKLDTDDYGKITAFKSRKFQFLPPVLFMNIKRYEYISKRKELRKINLDLSYPYELNLNFLMDTPGGEFNYILYAVVVHKGRSPNSGHYFTFINLSKEDPSTPEFYEFNDSMVDTANKKKVLHDFTGKKRTQIKLNEQYGKWAERQIDSEQTAYMLVYILKQKYIEFQRLGYTLPTWYMKKLQDKISEQERKNKMNCTIVSILKEQIYDPFMVNQGQQKLLTVNVKKQEPIEEAFMKFQPFLEISSIGSIWKVNTRSRIIKKVDQILGKKCALTLSKLCENKKGIRTPDYFLLLGSDKNNDINIKQPVGLLQTQHQRGQNLGTTSKLEIIPKSNIDARIKHYKQRSLRVTYQNEQLEFFRFGWTDFISITLE